MPKKPSKPAPQRAKSSKAAPKFVKDAKPPNESTLEKIRDEERKLRDLKLEIESLQEQVKDKNKSKTQIEFETLPDLFNKVGITNLGLQAEGNMPAFEGKLKPYYRANIAADWPDEKRQKAFDWLIKHGHGDLIKTEVVILLGRGDLKLLNQIKKLLRPILKQLDMSVDLAVPWGTLTAFIREQIEDKKETIPLDLFGAQVGQVVELKPVKEKKRK